MTPETNNPTSESYTHTINGIKLCPENRQMLYIENIRHRPGIKDKGGKQTRKTRKFLRSTTCSGQTDNGGYYTIYSDDDLEKYSVAPLHLQVKFNDVVSTFTPGRESKVYSNTTLEPILYTLRYGTGRQTPTLMEILNSDYNRKKVKSINGMNCIETYAEVPHMTDPVLIYQILTIAKTLYNFDRDKYDMSVITDNAGNVCNHTVQVYDVEEALINSASDIDFINLMYCNRYDLHKLICTILDATGYAGYSYTDTGFFTGVYTEKQDAGNTFYTDTFSRAVQRLDEELVQKGKHKLHVAGME